MPVKTKKGGLLLARTGADLKAVQPNHAHTIASREPFMIHLNLLSHPVMQRPMCSPVTDLPQNRQKENDCSTETGRPPRNPVTKAQEMILTDVSDTINADSLALFALNIEILLADVTKPEKSKILIFT